MAVLGAQLVITLVAVSVIQKLSPYYSFARWLICSTGLIRYVHPSNAELRILCDAKRKSKKSSHGQKEKLEVFNVPKDINLELEKTKITAEDLQTINYFQEYQWLIDFSLHATVVYALTEIWSAYYSIDRELNLSMFWCCIAMMFSFNLLLSLTGQYFRGGEESVAERSAVVVVGFLYLLCLMVLMIVDESILETGLNSAYDTFKSRATSLLQNQGIRSSGPASEVIVKFTIAIWCSVIGATLVFPGLRLARMHFDSLQYYSERKHLQLLLHLNFISPFILTLFWIRPIAHHYFTVVALSGMDSPLLTKEGFESMRLVILVVCMMLRISLTPIYMQSYLNLAYQRVQALSTEVGKITNVSLQKKVVAIFYYCCVVALQYLLPVVMCLHCAFMYKTMGGYSWNRVFIDCGVSVNSSKLWTNGTISHSSDTMIKDAIKTLTEPYIPESFYQLSLNTLALIFTKEVFRAIFGFTMWWILVSWFASSAVGLFYYMYFHQEPIASVT